MCFEDGKTWIANLTEQDRIENMKLIRKKEEAERRITQKLIEKWNKEEKEEYAKYEL
jgi:hypothetical protein